MSERGFGRHVALQLEAEFGEHWSVERLEAVARVIDREYIIERDEPLICEECEQAIV